jgi:hypothetical protein
MIKKLLKFSYAIAAVGFLFAQYALDAPASDDLVTPSNLEYLFPAPLIPQLSIDGKTLYNAVPPVIYVDDPNPSHEPLRIRGQVYLLTLPPESATATFSITYVPDGDTDAWGERCYAFPEEAKTAFNAAANIWANIIQSSVPITIRACWADFGSTSGILGYSGGGPIDRDFSGAPLPNTWYVGSLANSLAGSDLDPGDFDMNITYNRYFSWYYGTDGNTPPSKHDFMTVVLHEITHGLNFAGSMDYSGGWGGWGIGGYPIIYDVFMRDGAGNQLINTGIYGNPSIALGTALTSNNIWFHGSNAMTANGSQRVKMFAPTTWLEGSSYSHLDYNTFNDTPNQLMVYAISAGESIHDPGLVTIGILKDLGWSIPPEDIYVAPGGNCSGKAPCYSFIQDGIDAAGFFTTINVTQDTYTEDVILDESKVLTFRGGWDSTFTTNLSKTAIQGSLTISDGILIVENLILQ